MSDAHAPMTLDAITQRVRALAADAPRTAANIPTLPMCLACARVINHGGFAYGPPEEDEDNFLLQYCGVDLVYTEPPGCVMALGRRQDAPV